MKCPSFERLIDYLDGQLDQVEAEPLAAHMASGCEQCSGSADWYRRVRTVAATDNSVEPPAWVMKRALRIFETQHSRPRLFERIGRSVAALVFDSLAQPAVAGVRSTETASRQLLYQAADYSIDLQVARSTESRANLIAQVLRENQPRFESVAGLTVELIHAGERVAKTTTNEMGEFTIGDIAAGAYDLRVETNDGTITVPGLPLTI